MLADLPIFIDYGKRQENTFDSADVINLYLTYSKSGKKKFTYLNTPGLKLLKEVESGFQESRAFFVFDGYLYAVFGASIYRMGFDLFPVFIGSIGTSFGYVSIAVNNVNEIIFVDGQAGYLYKNSDHTFQRITAAGFPPQPLNVVCLDGYFVIPSGESRAFQVSGLNNGLSWDALDIAQVAAYPGLNMGVGVVNQRVFFLKTDSVAVWYDKGAADFPLRPDNNLLFNFGCESTSSIVSGFGMLFWLGKNADGVSSVMMTTGQEPKQVSTESEDNLIATFTNPSDVSVYLYKDGSHIFLSMNWTTDDVSLLYDVTMDMWYRQEMQQKLPQLGAPHSGKTRNLVNCHAYFNGKHIVGSYKKPIMYDMSRLYEANHDEPIMRQITGQHWFDPGYRKRQVNHVQLDMQMGLGKIGIGTGKYEDDNDDPLINPQVYLSISRDNRDFGNDVPAPLGKFGNTVSRAIWRKKGQARDWVMRFTIYAAVAPIVILGGAIDYEDLSV